MHYEDMSQVKVFLTNRRTDGQMERQMSFNVTGIHLGAGDNKYRHMYKVGHLHSADLHEFLHEVVYVFMVWCQLSIGRYHSLQRNIR